MDKKLIAICGEAVEELRKLPDKSINLTVTDPPHNLNKNYGTNQDNLAFDEYLEFSKQWLKEAYRVLTDNGSLYVFMGMKYISYIYSISEQEIGMYFNSWITWFYTQGIGKTKGFSQKRFVKDFLIKFTKNLHFRTKNKAGNLFLDSRPTVLLYAVRSAFNFFTSSRGSPAYSAIFSSVNIPSANILLAVFIAPSFMPSFTPSCKDSFLIFSYPP